MHYNSPAQRMKTNFYFALVSLALILAACSRLRDYDYTDQALEDRQKLIRIYDGITGTYEGQVEVGSQQKLAIELMLYTVEVQEGVDPDGNIRFRPALKAKYRNKNTVGESDDEVLDVRYFPQNGEVVFTSSNINSSSSFLSAHGSLIQEQLTAEITKNGGIYGTLVAKRTSRQTSSPDGIEAEHRARLRQLYEKITGTYSANLQQPQSSVRYPIEIALYITEVADGTTPSGEVRFKPQIEARYRSLEDPYSEWDNAKLEVRFYYETGELIMYAKEAQIGSFTIRSFFKNEALVDGEITAQGGLFGRFQAQRTSRDVVAPNDDELTRQRLRRVYEKLEGIYRGELRMSSGEIRKIEINMFIIDEVNNNGQTTPTLKARYRRLDFTPGIGEFYLSVRYFLRTGAIVMGSSANNTGGSGIPGAGTLSITGKWANKKIYDAEVFDHRGKVGSLTARK